MKQMIPLDDAAFDAAEDVIRSEPGSREHRNAQGRLIREAAKTTGRIIKEGVREGLKTLKSRDFWRGLRGKRKGKR